MTLSNLIINYCSFLHAWHVQLLFVPPSQVEKIEVECDKRVGEVSSMFAKVDERRQKRDVPDFLCGKISFEVGIMLIAV